MKYFFNDKQAKFIINALKCYKNDLNHNMSIEEHEQYYKMKTCDELIEYFNKDIL